MCSAAVSGCTHPVFRSDKCCRNSLLFRIRKQWIISSSLGYVVFFFRGMVVERGKVLNGIQ